MILHQLLLFCLSLAFGALSRLLYLSVGLLEKSINLRVITIILDLLMSAVIIIGFTIFNFVTNSGVFDPFMLMSAFAGFVAISVFV